MADILSSARPVSELRIRGDEKDDSDLYSIYLSNALMKARILDTQYSITSIALTVKNVRPKCQESQSRLAEFALHLLQITLITLKSRALFANFVVVACFYVQFAQIRKKPLGNHYTIYLTARTSLNLKVKLTEKLRIHLNIISYLLAQ
ncbi:hypothetical protein N7507_007844 [Penicillium longicatenatum]|nr:hypothetical protein N7507_007844 [Penicillium longicatenatum]